MRIPRTFPRDGGRIARYFLGMKHYFCIISSAYIAILEWNSVRARTGYFTNTANAIPVLGGVTPAFRNDAPETISMVRLTVLFAPDSRYDARFK
jgi:hypothetical protein